MAGIPIGLQLFSVRGECEKDLPAAVKAVSELGYTGAEPWGYNGQTMEWMGHSAADIRAMLDDAGLACCGFHVSTDALIPERLPRTVEFSKVLGNRFLIIAADRARMAAIDTIEELAGILNTASETAEPEGMYVGYHAHGSDFAVVERQTAWDHLFSRTRDEVIMQMDVGNCARGGGDPIATLRKFPNRARSLHLKDYGGDPGSAIGEGEADWETIFEIVDTMQNTEWFVVEEGARDGLGFDVCGRSLAALRAMGR